MSITAALPQTSRKQGSPVEQEEEVVAVVVAVADLLAVDVDAIDAIEPIPPSHGLSPRGPCHLVVGNHSPKTRPGI